MKRAREVGHAIANEWDASCMDHEVLGWSHGPRCDAATVAIEARDQEHEEEKRRVRDEMLMRQLAALDGEP